VHEPTGAYSKTPQGDKGVKVWTIMNIEPTVERGRTVRSLKSEHTVHCDRKTFSSILYAYEASFAKGEMVLDLDWIGGNTASRRKTGSSDGLWSQSPVADGGHTPPCRLWTRHGFMSA